MSTVSTVSVSVVIPTYNASRFIAEAVESVYAQTIPPSEVIVVDDGSTDQTPAILRQFEGRRGFRSLRKSNGGVASARNAGVQQATGEYIAFLDSDDVWRPQKLERQLANFDASWGMSFTAYQRVSASESQLIRHESWDPRPRVVISLLERSCVVGPPSTVLIRRDALRQVGPFEDVWPYGDDWLMWLRFAAAENEIGYLPEALTQYRWHDRNLSGDAQGGDEHTRFFDCALAVFDRYGDRRLRAWWRLVAAIHADEHQDPRRARRCIVEAARIRPWSIRPGWLRFI